MELKQPTRPNLRHNGPASVRFPLLGIVMLSLLLSSAIGVQGSSDNALVVELQTKLRTVSNCPHVLLECPRKESARQYREQCILNGTETCPEGYHYHCGKDKYTELLVEDCFETIACPAGNFPQVVYIQSKRRSILECSPCDKDHYQPFPVKSSHQFEGCSYERFTPKLTEQWPHLVLVEERWPFGADQYACNSGEGYSNIFQRHLCDVVSPCICTTSVTCSIDDGLELLPDGSCDRICVGERDPLQNFTCIGSKAKLIEHMSFLESSYAVILYTVMAVQCLLGVCMCIGFLLVKRQLPQHEENEKACLDDNFHCPESEETQQEKENTFDEKRYKEDIDNVTPIQESFNYAESSLAYCSPYLMNIGLSQKIHTNHDKPQTYRSDHSLYMYDVDLHEERIESRQQNDFELSIDAAAAKIAEQAIQAATCQCNLSSSSEKNRKESKSTQTLIDNQNPHIQRCSINVKQKSESAESSKTTKCDAENSKFFTSSHIKCSRSTQFDEDKDIVGNDKSIQSIEDSHRKESLDDSKKRSTSFNFDSFTGCSDLHSPVDCFPTLPICDSTFQKQQDTEELVTLNLLKSEHDVENKTPLQTKSLSSGYPEETYTSPEPETDRPSTGFEHFRHFVVETFDKMDACQFSEEVEQVVILKEETGESEHDTENITTLLTELLSSEEKYTSPEPETNRPSTDIEHFKERIVKYFGKMDAFQMRKEVEPDNSMILIEETDALDSEHQCLFMLILEIISTTLYKDILAILTKPLIYSGLNSTQSNGVLQYLLHVETNSYTLIMTSSIIERVEGSAIEIGQLEVLDMQSSKTAVCETAIILRPEVNSYHEDKTDRAVTTAIGETFDMIPQDESLSCDDELFENEDETLIRRSSRNGGTEVFTDDIKSEVGLKQDCKLSTSISSSSKCDAHGNGFQSRIVCEGNNETMLSEDDPINQEEDHDLDTQVPITYAAHTTGHSEMLSSLMQDFEFEKWTFQNPRDRIKCSVNEMSTIDNDSFEVKGCFSEIEMEQGKRVEKILLKKDLAEEGSSAAIDQTPVHRIFIKQDLFSKTDNGINQIKTSASENNETKDRSVQSPLVMETQNQFTQYSGQNRIHQEVLKKEVNHTPEPACQSQITLSRQASLTDSLSTSLKTELTDNFEVKRCMANKVDKEMKEEQKRKTERRRFLRVKNGKKCCKICHRKKKNSICLRCKPQENDIRPETRDNGIPLHHNVNEIGTSLVQSLDLMHSSMMLLVSLRLEALGSLQGITKLDKVTRDKLTEEIKKMEDEVIENADLIEREFRSPSFMRDLRSWRHFQPDVMPLANFPALRQYFERLEQGPVSHEESMNYEWLRLASLGAYCGPASAILLARNGFYHDPDHGPLATRCHACKLLYTTWEFYDNIEEVHRRLSPNCPLLQGDASASSNISIDDHTNRTSEGNAGHVSENRTSPGAEDQEQTTAVSNITENLQETHIREMIPEGFPQQPTDDRFNQEYTSRLSPSSISGSSIGRDVETGRSNLQYSGYNEGAPGSSSNNTATSENRPVNTPTARVPAATSTLFFTGGGKLRERNQGNGGFSYNSGDIGNVLDLEAAGINDPTQVVVMNPKHGDYTSLDARTHSFTSMWPSYLDQTPRQMAEAGFFYAGVADFTRCFTCGGGLRNWEAGDDPCLEHTRWYPRCEYMNKLKGTRYVQAVIRRQEQHVAEQRQRQRQLQQRRQQAPSNATPDPMTTPAAAVLLEMGYTRERVREAITTVRRNTGHNSVNAEQVLVWILDQDEQAASSTPASRPNSSGTATQSTATRSQNFTASSSTSSSSSSNSSTPQVSSATSTHGGSSNATSATSSASRGTSQSQRSKKGQGPPDGGATGDSRSRSGTPTRSKGNGGDDKSGGKDAKNKGGATGQGDQTPKKKKNGKKKGKGGAGAGGNVGGANANEAGANANEGGANANEGGAVGIEYERKQGSPVPSEADTRSLKAENQKLREMQTCKICMDKPVNMTLLPCGHLVCCESCAPHLRKCPICRKRIEGSVKTFMS